MIHQLRFFSLVFGLAALLGAASSANAEFYLAKDGRPMAAIVVENDTPVVQMAVQELQYHVRRASGAELPVVSPEAAKALPPERVRVVIGNGATAQALGADVSQLPVDTYIAKTQGNVLLFNGHDSIITERGHQAGEWNAATMWAVDRFLEEQLGVRWLWPGEVGTVVPLRKTIALPQLNITARPALEQRMLPHTLYRRSREGSTPILTTAEHEKVQQDAFAWQRRFQIGSRSTLSFGHAFGEWWDKYSAVQPELFAAPPPGSDYKMPWPVEKRVKLNLSNEAVDEKIIAEWQAAGAPDNWNVSPNDSTGFDTRAATRAMDEPPVADLEEIWRGRTNLTARYVKFWNRVITKMKRINPRVTLSTYAYSAYKEPPPAGLELDPAVTLQVVPHPWAYDEWRGWQRNGSKLFLRPNWWHTGAIAPIIPIKAETDFFKFALQNGMQGFYFDTMNGHWATQGPMYYAIARLSLHPEMSVEDILEEYSSAFGSAAPVIREYWNYWQEFTDKAAYPIAGFSEAGPGVKDGLYAKVSQTYGVRMETLIGSYPALPYLYGDEVLNPAYAILDRAAEAAKNGQGDGFVSQRIAFLRAGLDHLKLTRDVLRLGYKKSLTSEEQKTYLALTKELQEMRHRLTTQHVLWGEMQNWYEARYGVPTMPNRAKSKIERIEDA
jgi:hypothetical protein